MAREWAARNRLALQARLAWVARLAWLAQLALQARLAGPAGEGPGLQVRLERQREQQARAEEASPAAPCLRMPVPMARSREPAVTAPA